MLQDANYHLHEIYLHSRPALKYHKTAPFSYFTPNEDLWLKSLMIYIRVGRERKSRGGFIRSFKVFRRRTRLLNVRARGGALNNHVQMMIYQNHGAQH